MRNSKTFEVITIQQVQVGGETGSQHGAPWNSQTRPLEAYEFSKQKFSKVLKDSPDPEGQIKTVPFITQAQTSRCLYIYLAVVFPLNRKQTLDYWNYLTLFLNNHCQVETT